MGKAGGTFVGLDVLIDGLDAALEAGLDEIAEKAADQARRHAKGRLANEVEVVKPTNGFRAVQPTKAGYYGKWLENGRAGFVPKGATTKTGRARKSYHKAASVIMFFKNGVQHFATKISKAKAEPYMVYANDYLTNQASQDLQAVLDKAH